MMHCLCLSVRGLFTALVLAPLATLAAHAQQGTGVPGSGAAAKPPYNIVFLIVDQRTYRLLAGADYSLPALDSIARHGVTFQNHYISSAMCSPSRASFLTGQPPQVNGVIDQMEYAFQQSLRPDLAGELDLREEVVLHIEQQRGADYRWRPCLHRLHRWIADGL
jgi:hypothetical protein